jgi:hypothetical protein
MEISPVRDPSAPDPSEFDGGQPERTDADGPDVLFPDILDPDASRRALPLADEGDVVEQQTMVPDDDVEDERRD